MKHLSLAAVGAALSALAMSASAELTFTRDVLPILQENCQTCHRPAGTNLSGMIAPMSLMTYEEVRPWAKSIVKAIESKEMPPWDASEKYHGVFQNERTLTDDQIALVRDWVAQGAKRGNPTDAPDPVQWSETGWNFGTPDLVVDFPEPYFVADEVEDLYYDIHTTLTEEQLPSDKWISGIEFKPGSEVVHHIIGHAYAPGEEKNERRGMLGGNAPGADESSWPEGFGIELKKGSTIRFAMHYHKEPGPGTGMYDSSQIGLQFHEQPATHPIEVSPIAHGKFEIPPYHDGWRVGASRTFDEDTYLLSMLPHMHLRGTYAKYTAFFPDGTTEELLEVPAWDFNWQTGYGYPEPRIIPAGTRIEMEFVFTNNEEQAAKGGFNPGRAVRFGGPTTDEMDLAWITVAPVKPTELSKTDSAEQTGD